MKPQDLVAQHRPLAHFSGNHASTDKVNRVGPREQEITRLDKQGRVDPIGIGAGLAFIFLVSTPAHGTDFQYTDFAAGRAALIALEAFASFDF
jgi:hypothetical protein